mmetsp:Transcript_21386/g.29968  ORF Transcript_21386/g.29968 Transcript_21386/m.29968 type:complete len:539 (+) Transcript_21386:33-1649(+)
MTQYNSKFNKPRRRGRNIQLGENVITSKISSTKWLGLVLFGFGIVTFLFTSFLLHLMLTDQDQKKGGASDRGRVKSILFRKDGDIRNVDENNASGISEVEIGGSKRLVRNRRRDQNGDKIINKEDTHKEMNKKKGKTIDTSGSTSRYKSIRDNHERKYPVNDMRRIHEYVSSIKDPPYESVDAATFPDGMPYDTNDCPDHPPPGYPMEWLLMDVLNNWIPNDTNWKSNETSGSNNMNKPKIYRGLCRFDFATERYKAVNYRRAEQPFILFNDTDILRVAERWHKHDYLMKILGEDVQYPTEYSTSNHLMFYRLGRNKPQDWKPPIHQISMTYEDWLEKANQPVESMTPNDPHWYFRINAKDNGEHFLFHELPFFHPDATTRNQQQRQQQQQSQPQQSQHDPFDYIINPEGTRGINCRFGMSGNIAETHFDSSRNFIMLFGGERRYILSHPQNCPKLGLYPRMHPSARHSALDWSNPDLEQYPLFSRATANEVVLQAGDALYLPTNWFHFIVSIDMNWQCNARSGRTSTYDSHIQKCGF